MYSFMMSFWMVPRSSARSTPCRSPTATYIAKSTAAGALIVIDVDTSSRGMSSNTRSKSSSESMATPDFPTSPAAIAASESYPIWVGRSNAIDSPEEP